jgi:hypothetical protein
MHDLQLYCAESGPVDCLADRRPPLATEQEAQLPTPAAAPEAKAADAACAAGRSSDQAVSPASSQAPLPALDPQREPSLVRVLSATTPLPAQGLVPPLVSESPFVGTAPAPSAHGARAERNATVRRAVDVPPGTWGAAVNAAGKAAGEPALAPPLETPLAEDDELSAEYANLLYTQGVVARHMRGGIVPMPDAEKAGVVGTPKSPELAHSREWHAQLFGDENVCADFSNLH